MKRATFFCTGSGRFFWRRKRARAGRKKSIRRGDGEFHPPEAEGRAICQGAKGGRALRKPAGAPRTTDIPRRPILSGPTRARNHSSERRSPPGRTATILPCPPPSTGTDRIRRERGGR